MIHRLPFASTVLALSLAAVPLFAQGPPGPEGPPRQPPPTQPLQVHQLDSSVYWANGGVGNVGFVVGDHGVVVIDTTISVASAKELLADIARVTPKPVTAVIITHSDMDHVSGLDAFPAGIPIYAQDKTKDRVTANAVAGRGRVSAEHVPNHGVGNHETLTLEGQTFDLYHWAPAHTDGDLVIYLPKQRIMFAGDILALDQPRPLIHAEQDGTSLGWIETVRGMLALPATQIVPGHGDVQGKPAVEARLQQAVTERDQIKSMIAEGKTLPEIQAAVDDPPAGATAAKGGGPRMTPYSAVVYNEITGKK